MYNVKVRMQPHPKTRRNVAVGQLASTARISLDEIAERIAAQTTLTPTDVIATLAGMQEQMIYALRNGQSVRLDGLGTFYPQLRTRMEHDQDKFTADSIRSLRVGFRPAKAFKATLQPGAHGVSFNITKPQ